MRFTSDHKQALLQWLPAIFFAVAIFMFSSTPGKKVSDSFDSLSAAVQTVSPANSQVPAFSAKIEWLKIGHGIGYLCLGLTVLYALTTASRWSPLTALIICVFYSVTDEFHQAMIPGRSASSRDVLLDSLASLAGILVLLGIVRWGVRRKSRQAHSLHAN
jgi:VanZ family protein